MPRTKKALIIEDDPETARVFEGALARKGFAVSVAADGLVGLNKARAEHPDLIVVELFLPSLNGYWVSAFLKRNKLYQNIKILAVSSMTAPETHTLLAEAEIDNFIHLEDKTETRRNSTILMEKIDLALT